MFRDTPVKLDWLHPGSSLLVDERTSTSVCRMKANYISTWNKMRCTLHYVVQAGYQGGSVFTSRRGVAAGGSLRHLRTRTRASLDHDDRAEVKVNGTYYAEAVPRSLDTVTQQWNFDNIHEEEDKISSTWISLSLPRVNELAKGWLIIGSKWTSLFSRWIKISTTGSRWLSN